MNPLRWDTLLARAMLCAAAALVILWAGSAQAQLPPALEDTVASRDNADALAGGQVGAVSSTATPRSMCSVRSVPSNADRLFERGFE